MKLSLTINDVKNEKDIENLGGNFMVSDIAGALKAINRAGRIINIYSHYDKNSMICDRTVAVQEVINKFKDDKDVVICTTAYISTEEFPESEYYLDKIDSSKKPIPVDEVLKRETCFLERIRFQSINNYTQYAYKEAYIYPNELGKLVKEYLDSLLSDFEEKKNTNRGR